MKIFLAILLAFALSLAEQNLTKEMINKEMIKQITTPDEIMPSKGYEEFCAQFVNDLKTGNDIEVLRPMNKEEIEEARAKVENLSKLPDGRPMSTLHNMILIWDEENKDAKVGYKTTFYKLWDDKYIREFEMSSDGVGESQYGLSVQNTATTGTRAGERYHALKSEI